MIVLTCLEWLISSYTMVTCAFLIIFVAGLTFSLLRRFKR